ncbi:MAG TPA: hypothetical protein VJ045_11685 [Hyphomicrobiaceae bacterium]|nr:hypothetical protein [Hyphomicrobiaceae bacterium]
MFIKVDTTIADRLSTWRSWQWRPPILELVGDHQKLTVSKLAAKQIGDCPAWAG